MRSVEMPGEGQTSATRSSRPSFTPASSIASRRAAASGVSPSSTMPAIASSIRPSRPA